MEGREEGVTEKEKEKKKERERGTKISSLQSIVRGKVRWCV